MNLRILGLVCIMLFPLFSSISCKSIQYIPIEQDSPILPAKIDKIVLEQYDFDLLYELSPSIEYTDLLNELEKTCTINDYIAFTQEVKRMLRDIKVDQITKNMTDEEYQLEYERLMGILKIVDDEISKLKSPTQ